MRAYAMIAVVVTVGCSAKSKGGGDDDQPPPDPKGWTITVDMSGLDRYVTGDATTWPVTGTATATEGLADVSVDGTAVTVGDGGAFMGSANDVMPGLTHVAVLAHDTAGNQRKGDRSLLSAQFLPEGSGNPHAAALVLDNAILAAMGSSIAGQAGTIDVAGEILAQPILSQDDRCTTWPTAASQGTVTVALVQQQGQLKLHIQIPNLDVQFAGQCQGVFQMIPIAGEFGGTVDVFTDLTAKAPGDSGCVTAFAHSTPDVSVGGWGFSVWGTGGPLQNWIVDLFSGQKADEARTQLIDQVGTRADQMLDEKLANVQVFDRDSQVALLGQHVDLHLCLGGLDKVGNKLIARVAGAAIGMPPADDGGTGGDRMAPGAPQLAGNAPTPAAKELVLDANLVAQLLYSAWREGALNRPAPDADISVLQILVPALADHFTSSTAQVTIDGELPPVVRATPGGPGKLSIELGDVMVDLSLEGTRIFRFGVVLTLQLDLAPMAGKLVPTVVDATAQVALLDELYDGPDDALEQAIQLQIGNVASQLIGADAAIALPDLPGLGTPTAVKADAGGRFLHVTLQ